MIFLISLILIIILHELSHFIVAKLCKCKVSIFSIGFWKPIFSFEWKDTRYNFTPLLFGGYVNLKGELDYTEDKDGFINLSYRKKFLISIAGVGANIIIGIVALLLGNKLLNFNLKYFGYFSLWAGLINLLPTLPCLDGSYLIYYPIIIKKFGKKIGVEIIKTIVKISFTISIIISVLLLPGIVYLFIKGLL